MRSGVAPREGGEIHENKNKRQQNKASGWREVCRAKELGLQGTRNGKRSRSRTYKMVNKIEEKRRKRKEKTIWNFLSGSPRPTTSFACYQLTARMHKEKHALPKLLFFSSFFFFSSPLPNFGVVQINFTEEDSDPNGALPNTGPWGRSGDCPSFSTH